ncbi:SAM-dependent methyltransferase [Kosmotoga arenicorallina S304]|uniref:SAM-dependent methyltransferase n=1 Tax=Kosmotoga arenicorallina S304 TaxID=1453497 RepID=A0A176K2J3_9BACT|nr:class I SAM-dependent rRNA methyltransferase [Kosmotoga arenicorallina]OAA31288.1 SAM-dependent methyltransferase [Kosmotoga arenicorallina S304]
MLFPRAILKPRLKRRVFNGHPWVYDNEIDTFPECEDGSLVDLFTSSGQFVGRGYYNSRSTISIRLLTRKYENIDEDFFVRKIQKAFALRSKYSETSAYRLIFGESDGLPGLVVDRYSNYFVMQISTLGMSLFRESILSALIKLFNPKGIYEKSEGAFLKLEGIPQVSEWLYGSGPTLIPFKMNDIQFLADLMGQKTGFFLDQRCNARFLSRFASEKRVLDVFSYTGNFALHLLKGGAHHATLLDQSERALEVAKEVSRLNGLPDKISVIKGNAFDFLRNLNPGDYDLIIIDPPALVKNAKYTEKAIAAYKELNLRAIRALKEGLLATSSCTQAIREDAWLGSIHRAFNDSKKIGLQLFSGSQPFDHPVSSAVFETNYLKFRAFYIRKISDI